MIIKFNKKLIKNKTNILSIFVICIVFAFFIVNPVSAADVGGAVATVLGWIASLLTSVIGYFLTFLIKILVNVANFNNIIDVPAVKNGWVIVRDLCNMFFVLILLVIAFAAILRIESYSWKRLLPKLLIMAILINFSKTIFGLIIDFSQVIMLTFVGGFGGENAGNFLVNAFQIQKMGAITNSPGVEVSGWATSVAIILGVIAMLIAFVVVVVMLAVLIMRVMMLWIYTILSPLVFLGFAFPPIQKYVGRIWEDFIKQVIIGPMLAFFLWLALTTAGESSNKISSITAPTGASQAVTGGVNALFQEGNFQTFIIVIGMLVGGLMVTQQMGGAAGAAAGRGIGAIHRGAGVGKAIGRAGVFKAGRTLDKAQMWAQKKTIGRRAEDYMPKSLNYRMIAQGWKTRKATEMAKYERGLTGTWADTFDKHLRLSQYGAIRKSKKKIVEDETKAHKLGFENRMIQKRINYSKLSADERTEERDKLIRDREQIEQRYREAGFDSMKEFTEDINALEYGERYNVKVANDKIKENDNGIAQLTEHVKFKFVPFVGRDKFAPHMAIYSKGGEMELSEKEAGEMKQRTGEKDFAVIGELLHWVNKKDSVKTSAALRILSANNDLNEAAKDSRMTRLMTKQNGLLEKLYKEGRLKGVENEKQLEDVKNDYRSNPVTPAYVQAMIEGLFKETKTDNNIAAKHADIIGGLSFNAGNSLAFGMSYGDVKSGNYKFNDLKFADGTLQASTGRERAIVGKFSNLESQLKMRTQHPNVVIAEDIDGNGTGIHEAGEAYLKSLTSHDLAQINRVRLDNVRKIGGNPRVLKAIKKLAQDLERTGDKRDEEQAQIIKTYAGYLKSKFEGKGLEGEKWHKDALQSYEDI